MWRIDRVWRIDSVWRIDIDASGELLEMWRVARDVESC